MGLTKQEFIGKYFREELDIKREILVEAHDTGELKDVVFSYQGKTYQIGVYVEYGSWELSSISIPKSESFIEVEPQVVADIVYKPKAVEPTSTEVSEFKEEAYTATLWLHRSMTKLLVLAKTREQAHSKVTNQLRKFAEEGNKAKLISYLDGVTPNNRYDFSLNISEEPIDMSISNGVIPISIYNSEFPIG